MYTGSEDGTVKIWDLRARGCQRDYESRAPVNTVVLHPNQAELVSGDRDGVVRYAPNLQTLTPLPTFKPLWQIEEIK